MDNWSHLVLPDWTIGPIPFLTGWTIGPIYCPTFVLWSLMPFFVVLKNDYGMFSNTNPQEGLQLLVGLNLNDYLTLQLAV